MKKIEEEFIRYIEANPSQSKKSAIKTTCAIQNSPLAYKVPGQQSPVAIYTHTLQIPKFFNETDQKRFEALCSSFYVIFEKTIRAWKADPAVRDLFGFSPRLSELVMEDSGYASLVPMLRIDVFYNEETGDFKVCEFNTDGTSAMYENRMTDEFLSLNNAWNEISEHWEIEHQELMDSWVDAFLLDVEQATGNTHPSIAIADYLENAYLPELYAFADVFKARGLTCEVVDVRDFAFDGTSLQSAKTGTHFDAIYRRAVTSDVMNHYDESSAFLDAVRMKKAVLIGGFQTQVIHSKAISEALFSPVLRKYFTDEEKDFLDRHLPASFDLTAETARWVMENKDTWIIKPKEGYGAKGVWAGVDVSDKLWKKLIEDSCSGGFIAQTYIPHYKTPNIDLLVDENVEMYANLTGLYVYNGRFAGVYSRLSNAGIVSTQYNERMVPTLFVKDDEPSDK